MKKRIAIIIMMMAVLSAGARAELRFGPIAGANISNFYFKQDLISHTQLVGPNAGVIGEVIFSGIGLGMDFGLRYQMHGARLGLGDRPVWALDGYGTQDAWVHSLQIPINLRFKYTNLESVERIIAPFAYAGPVFNITLAHNKVSPVGNKSLQALEYPGGCIGVQVGLGAELFEHLQISAGYYWGLTYEIRTIKLENFSARPQGWQVNVAYLF